MGDQDNIFTLVVPIYKHVTSKKASGFYPLWQVLHRIKSCDAEVIAARNETDGAEFDKLKKARWCIKFGTDGEKKAASDTGEATGIIYLDVDKSELPDSFKASPPSYILAYWRSFSGKGYGILAHSDTVETKTYDEHYHAIGAELNAMFGINCDPSCINPNRINFASGDTELWQADAKNVSPYSLPTIKDFTANAEYEAAPERYTMSKNGVDLFRMANNDSNLESEMKRLLSGNGWSEHGKYWTRPGKKNGCSAVWNENGAYAGKFKVYTSEAHDLPCGMYDLFALYSNLVHNNDTKRAYSTLSERYGVSYTKSAKAPRAATYVRTPQNISIPDPTNFDGAAFDVAAIALSLNLPTVEPILPIRPEKLPPKFRYVAEMLSKNMAAPIEYAVLNMITILAACTQNKVWVRHRTQTEKLSLWGISVGLPGVTKSPPLSFLIAPFYEKQKALDEAYQTAFEQYEHELDTYENLGKADKLITKRPKAPTSKTCIVTTFTIELVYQEMARNGGTMLVYSDEVIQFLAGLGKYSKGANTEIYEFMSMWSGNIVNRRTKTSQESIQDPHICVVGTGTPEKIWGYMAQNGLATGLYERFLYAIAPDNFEREPDYSEGSHGEIWTGFVNKLFDEFSLPGKLIWLPDAAALARIDAFDKEMREKTRLFNRAKNSGRAQLFAKLKTYYIRFLAISRLVWAALEEPPEQYVGIGARDCDFADELIRYFQSTLLHAWDNITYEVDGSILKDADLSKHRRNIVKQIRAQHKNLTGAEIADVVNYLTQGHKPIAASTIYSWLKNL